MVKLNGESFIFIISREVFDQDSFRVKSSITPVHMFPFCAWDEPAEDIIKLFPNKSSSVDEKIVQAKESSANNVTKWFLHLFKGLEGKVWRVEFLLL